MAKEIRIGLVGYKFMGRAHSNAYRQVSAFFDPKAVPVMKVICGRNEDGVRQAAEKFGWESYETSWEKLIERDDIDLVDISTPGDSHKPIAIAAAKAGKDILCEKPLANNLKDAEQMLAAVQKAGVKHMVGFNYRRVPAVTLAKQMIEEGRIGEIYHFRAVYLQDWIVDPDFPLVWRLQKEKAGSGPHGDLNAHIIDLARYLVGEIDEVVGMSKTFISERPLPEEMTGLAATASSQKGKVTVEDAALFLAKFKNGALGSFEATRFATGRKNYNHFEINGSKGSLVFTLEDMNYLEFYSRQDDEHIQGFRKIMVTEAVHPYVSAWWPPGHIIGYEHTFVHQAYDLMNALAEDKMPSPNFVDGVACQKVLEAVEQSINKAKWVKV
ncbi:dehydrogenase [candidate division KSB1 bacterium 4484_219]|nr:MAG: dehydrogenase [candidate division KSB1 bacterium 4484_219]